jgi:uncharacterized membrane protein YeaQ/YmgE (transglycosylase-associated protein family)
MSLPGFLLLLVIAFICGAVSQALAGGSRGGCLVTIAVGFIGSLLGTWIAQQLDLPEILSISIGGDQKFPIVWSIMGGALFCAVLGLLNRQRPRS